ncbi:MAG: HPr family phosphocarrier protein [Anaerolineae bacterium]
MPAIELVVRHSAGLHARPAAQFVKTAASFPCTITVQNLTTQKPPANAKSVLSVMTQGVVQNTTIRVEAEGDRADEALAALQALVDGNFGEGGH